MRRNTETLIPAATTPMSPIATEHAATNEKTDNFIQKKHSPSNKPSGHSHTESPTSDVRMSDNPAFFNADDQVNTTNYVSKIVYDESDSVDEYEGLSDVEEEDEEDEEEDNDDDEGSVYEDIDAGDSDAEGELVNNDHDSKVVGVKDHHVAGSYPWTSRVDLGTSLQTFSVIIDDKLLFNTGINSRNPDGSRGNEIYYIGVIDILQRYNINKRAETLFKVMLS